MGALLATKPTKIKKCFEFFVNLVVSDQHCSMEIPEQMYGTKSSQLY